MISSLIWFWGEKATSNKFILDVKLSLAAVCWVILLIGDKVSPEGTTLSSNLTLSVILFFIPTAGWSRKIYSIFD